MWPVLLASAGSAGLSGLSTYYQIEQKNERLEQKAEYLKEEAKAAQQQRELKTKILSQKRRQLADAAGMAKEKRRRQQQREESMLRASFGASGVAGNTPLRQLYTSQLQEEYDNSITQKNFENKKSQTYLDELSVNIGANSAIRRAEHGIDNAESQQTSGLAAGLMIGNSMLQGAASGASAGMSMGKAFG